MGRTDHDRRYHYFPAFLDLVRKHVVVVGGGSVAASKVEALLPCGTSCVTIVAPEVCKDIAEHATAGRVRWLPRRYAPGDIAEADLVLAASDDRTSNAAVVAEARGHGILVLAVDDVPNCDLIAPALVRRGDLVIAVSTQGRSPAMARRVREWLDAAIPERWGELLEIAAAVRERLGSRRRSISPECWQAALRAIETELSGSCDRGAAVERLTERLVTR